MAQAQSLKHFIVNYVSIDENARKTIYTIDCKLLMCLVYSKLILNWLRSYQYSLQYFTVKKFRVWTQMVFLCKVSRLSEIWKVSLFWVLLCWMLLCWVSLYWVSLYRVSLYSVITMSVIMLSIVILSVIILSVIMLSVVMLNDTLLNVVSPTKRVTFKI